MPNDDTFWQRARAAKRRERAVLKDIEREKNNDTPDAATPAAAREDGTPFQTASFTDVVEAFERRDEREAQRRAEIDAAARRAIVTTCRLISRARNDGGNWAEAADAESAIDRLEAAMKGTT